MQVGNWGRSFGVSKSFCKPSRTETQARNKAISHIKFSIKQNLNNKKTICGYNQKQIGAMIEGLKVHQQTLF